MPVERSAGAIIFRETPEGRRYLLLHYIGRDGKDGHWDFSKGHIERGEKTEDAVRRETAEETGIRDIIFIPGFKETIRYFVNYDGERRLKFVAFFLARAIEERVVISFEHQGSVWLPYEQAYDKITYKNSKEILKHAHDFLQKNI